MVASTDNRTFADSVIDDPTTATAYDHRGSMTEYGDCRYVYDYLNRLIEVKHYNSGTTNWDSKTTYTYDALNRLVTRTDVVAGTMTVYIYSGARVVEEYRGWNRQTLLARSYVYASGHVDERILMRDYDGGDGTPAGDSYYLIDRQHSVAAAVNAAGVVRETYEYEAYGSMTIRNAAGADITASGSAIGNPYGYTGRRFDGAASGGDLWQYRSRWYSHKLGRFLTRDGAGYVDGANLYRYVRNNPLRFLDPLGLFTPEGAMEAYRQQYADNEKAIRRWTGVWPPARACICSRGSG